MASEGSPCCRRPAKKPLPGLVWGLELACVLLQSCRWDLGPAVDRATQKMRSALCVPAKPAGRWACDRPSETAGLQHEVLFLVLPEAPLLWASALTSGSLADLANAQMQRSGSWSSVPCPSPTSARPPDRWQGDPRLLPPFTLSVFLDLQCSVRPAAPSG